MTDGLADARGRHGRATPSWARPTRRPGARPVASSTCRSPRRWPPSAAATRRPRTAAAAKLGWASVGDRLAAAARAATTSTSSTSARRATPTPRSPSRRWRPASTCCARSRWPTPSPRPRRWPRRPSARRAAASARWSASTTAGCPASPWPASWSPRAGSATIRHVRAQYLQDWIVDPEFPLVWRLQKDQAGSGALGDIGAHIVDLAQFVTGQPIDRRLGPDRDVREGAPAAGGVERAGRRRAAPRRGDGHRRRRRAVHRPVRRRARSASFEATRFATGRKNAMRLEINGSRRQPGVRLRVDERAVVPRPHRGRRDGGLPPHPGHRARHPYLAAWWPPGHVLGYEHTFTHEVVDLVARSPPAATRAVLRRRAAGAAGAGGRGARRRPPAAAGQPTLSSTTRATAPAPEEQSMTPTGHPVHRPVGRPAVRGGVPAGRPSGATTAWRSPAGATTSRSTRPPRTTPTSTRKLDAARQARPAGVRDLQPPRRPGGLRRPDRRAAPGHPARPHLGRRRPRGRAAARRGGDEGHRAGGRAARRRHRRRLHRLDDLEHGRDVPAGAASR